MALWQIGAPSQRSCFARLAAQPSVAAACFEGVSAARRVRLALARERHRGVPFEEAWTRVLAGERGSAASLEWAREEFRAGYERRPSRLSALTELERERQGVRVLG